MININENELFTYNKFELSDFGINSDIYIHNDKLLKIIHDNTLKENPDIKNNIEYLINFKHQNISFPTDIIYMNNCFKGYEMNMLSGYNLLKKIEKICEGNDDLSFNDIIKIKNNLLELVSFFSSNGILMEDPNISNILVDNNHSKYTDLDFYKESTNSNLYTTNLFRFNYYFKDIFLIILNKNRNINLLDENVYLKNMLYFNEKNNLNYINYIDDILSLLNKDNINSLKELKEYKRR